MTEDDQSATDKELLEVVKTITEYLKMPSTDGRPERQLLRKKLKELLKISS